MDPFRSVTTAKDPGFPAFLRAVLLELAKLLSLRNMMLTEPSHPSHPVLTWATLHGSDRGARANGQKTEFTSAPVSISRLNGVVLNLPSKIKFLF